jgi:hypothetical protein
MTLKRWNAATNRCRCSSVSEAHWRRNANSAIYGKSCVATINGSSAR